MPNIIINNYCNQKCSYCFAEDSMTIQKNKYNTQSLFIFLSILKFLKKYNYVEVRLLGWEPLLHPNINNFINIWLKWWFDLLIFSNLNFDSEFLLNIFNNVYDYKKVRINCNLNNLDFYTEEEYKNIETNIKYLINIWVDIVIWYNVYDLSKNFEDIYLLSKKLWIKKINLKVTNTVYWKDLIVDTWSREYWAYLFNIVNKYYLDFKFEFSCWLDRNIFLDSEINFFLNNWINLLFWCDWFAWKFDIDIDWSIYKCFPTRSFYIDKKLNIFNYNPLSKEISSYWLKKSENNCSAHLK